MYKHVILGAIEWSIRIPHNGLPIGKAEYRDALISSILNDDIEFLSNEYLLDGSTIIHISQCAEETSLGRENLLYRGVKKVKIKMGFYKKTALRKIQLYFKLHRGVLTIDTQFRFNKFRLRFDSPLEYQGVEKKINVGSFQEAQIITKKIIKDCKVQFKDKGELDWRLSGGYVSSWSESFNAYIN